MDAADWLRSELDVSKPFWSEACLAMGREQAAIAIAIVSTRDPEHFRTTTGGYFDGMVAKEKAGELNLDRTLWAMLRAAEPGARRRLERGDSLPGQVNREQPCACWFLSAHAMIYGHFRLRRHLMGAASYRCARGKAFRIWRQETCVHHST